MHLFGTDSRALSLPGAPGEIFITSWYKGANFENLLFRSHVVNGAVFKMRSISAAPLYDDADGVQAEELPRLVGTLGLYGFDHVLLHKDFLTSYRMAFDYQRYKVLGPLTALESERFLDHDSRLTKEVRRAQSRALQDQTGGHAGPRLWRERRDAGGRLRRCDAAVRRCRAHRGETRPAAVVSRKPDDSEGRSGPSARRRDAQARDERCRRARSTPRRRRSTASRSPCRDNGSRRSDPTTSSPAIRSAFVYAQPHGDWLTGARPQAQNLDGHFSLGQRPTASRRPWWCAPNAFRPKPPRCGSATTRTWRGRSLRTATNESPTVSWPKVCRCRPCARSFAVPVTRLSSGRLGVSYSISLHAGAKAPELAVAGIGVAHTVAADRRSARHARLLAGRHHRRRGVAARRPASCRTATRSISTKQLDA